MKRNCLLVSLFLAGIFSVQGQTVQIGRGHLAAERFELAEQTFQQILKTNPADPEALYWGGQAMVAREIDSVKKITVARSWYGKALAAAPNAPLVMIGAGYADLLEGKVNEARQKFESALTMTRMRKAENIDMLNAVSRANLDAKSGDPLYLIEKMKVQAEKGDKNAEMYLLLATAYLRAFPKESKGGSEAFYNVREALRLNPGYALAHYRLARLFYAVKNFDQYRQNLDSCIKKDPGFTPAYYELFYYYFTRRDFDAAQKQLQLYINSKLPEKDIQDEFLYSQICMTRQDFPCVIAKAESVVAVLGSLTKPRVYRLLADAFYQQGDTLFKQQQTEAAAASWSQAKKYSDLFFTRTGEDMDGVILFDYQLRADIMEKIGGTSPDEIVDNYKRATQVDTLLGLKLEMIGKAADRYKIKGDSASRMLEGRLRILMLSIKPNPVQRDLYDAGIAYYKAKNYAPADSLFGLYAQKYPEEIFGYMYKYEIQRALDTSKRLGTAVPWAEKYLSLMEKDSVKYKRFIYDVSGYLADYSINVLKDKDKALIYLRKMLAINPANVDLQKNIEILEKSPQLKPATPPNPNPANGTKAPAQPGKPNQVALLLADARFVAIAP